MKGSSARASSRAEKGKAMKTNMRKILTLLLALVIFTLCSCSGGGNGKETEAASTAAGTEAGSAAGTDAGTASGDGTQAQETEAPGTNATETEPSNPGGEETDAPDPNDTTVPFDKTQPWDGVSACFDWYVHGDYSHFEIKDAYDLYGLTLIVSRGNVGGALYYDANGMLILDTNGDGSVEDEAGYNADRAVGGDKLADCTVYLTNDIDLNGKIWLPIGYKGSFQGIFDGDGHTVSNWVVDGSVAYAGTPSAYHYGFFAWNAYDTIQNLTLSNGTINVDAIEGGRWQFIGIFGGSDVQDCHLKNCNLYDITVNINNENVIDTYLGYTFTRIRNVTSSVENVNVYNFTVNNPHNIEIKENAYDGFIGNTTVDILVTGCQVLTSDPR